MKKLFLLLMILGLSVVSKAQVYRPPLILTSNPTGACDNGRFAINIASNTFFYCAGSVWNSGGGTSTVTNNYITNTVGSGLLTGGGVEWTGNLNFTVAKATYLIGGVQYSTTTDTNITLTAADATNPRIDAIVLTSSNTAIKVDGTASATPALPSVDPTTELLLTFVYVAANATTPTNVSDTDIYLENTEWTCTPSAHFNCANTVSPISGTKDILGTAVVATNNVTLVKPAAGTENLATYTNLVLTVKSTGIWPNAKSLSIYWLNGSTIVGNSVTLRDGSFGFSSANITNPQLLVIPANLFNTATNLVTTLEIQATGGGSSFGMHIDNIKLQGGITGIPPTQTNMVWRGAWSSATTYSINDVVLVGGISYICVLANLNHTPPNATYWTALSTTGTGTVTSITASSPLSGGTITTTGSIGVTSGAVSPTYLSTNANLRTCMIVVGADNAASVLADADLGPQGQRCTLPYGATVTEVRVDADSTGTPSVIVRKKAANGTTYTNLLSGALATSGTSNNNTACASINAACYDGSAKSGSVTIVTSGSANVLAAGESLGLTSGTAGGVSKRMSVSIYFTVN